MTSEKINLLLKDERNLYHTQDLMVLWGIKNPNTLYTTIARYKKRGVLYKMSKGFYSVKPVKELNPYLTGLRFLRRYGYLSTESVLRESGLITQDVKYITLISDVSRRFEIGGHKFIVRKMKEVFLHSKEGLLTVEGVRKATVERAVADMLYFNSKYYFDGFNTIDWDEVNKIKKKIGYD